jgi:hypothetical protein
MAYIIKERIELANTDIAKHFEEAINNMPPDDEEDDELDFSTASGAFNGEENNEE